jgi:1-acyl-sn-glycerol-3-phosphate acyltransferase
MSSKNNLAHKILYGLMGWTSVVTEELPERCIICLAPHTSNWDFIMGMLFSRAQGFRSNFLMKKEWFFWPVGGMMRKLGGIPVFRSKKSSMTDHLAEVAMRSRTFRLCITPEGTRKLNPDWKHGFYYIALKAEIPILLYTLDYEKKEITCTRKIIPSGDVEQDMRTIKLHYKDVKGKYPEKFSIGDIEA